jgi:hypothetical protein
LGICGCLLHLFPRSQQPQGAAPGAVQVGAGGWTCDLIIQVLLPLDDQGGSGMISVTADSCMAPVKLHSFDLER